MPPLVSVIVPVRADREPARALLTQIPVDPRAETIVIEAGNDPGPESLAAGRPDVTVIQSPQGRGVQMNAGARLARGEWLLFLHADSRLPADWLDLFQATVQEPEHRTVSGPVPRRGSSLDDARDDPELVEGSGRPERQSSFDFARDDLELVERSKGGSRVPNSAAVIGGWFRFALDDSAWQARLIERGVAWRSRVLKLPYGDQGLFVRRQTFAELGGYREWPLMEDVEFVRRLARAGSLVEVPAAIATSSRRWRRDGWFRRSTRNLTILTLYFCGVPPRLLARWY